jgi:hypothetical protein
MTKVLRRVRQKPFDAGINGNSGSWAFNMLEIAAHRNAPHMWDYYFHKKRTQNSVKHEFKSVRDKQQ